MTSKIKILSQNLALLEGQFDHFGGQKSRLYDFLKVGLELFRRCLGIIFGLKSATFRRIFSSKGPIMASKIKIFSQNLALWEGHFDNFQGEKTRFLVFLKVVLEMIRGYLGINFGCKKQTFKCILAQKVDLLPPISFGVLR